LEHIRDQGLGAHGPGKPIGIPELLAILDETRQHGYSVAARSRPRIFSSSISFGCCNIGSAVRLVFQCRLS